MISDEVEREVISVFVKNIERCLVEAGEAVVLSGGGGGSMWWGVWDERCKCCWGIDGPQVDDVKCVGGEVRWP